MQIVQLFSINKYRAYSFSLLIVNSFKIDAKEAVSTPI